MGTASTRAFKEAWIRNRVYAVNNAGEMCGRERLIAQFMSEFSSTRRTALEIIEQLETLGELIHDGCEIWTPAAWAVEKVSRRGVIKGKTPEEIISDVNEFNTQIAEPDK